MMVVTTPISGRSLSIIEWSANIMLWSGGIILSISPELAKSSWKLFAVLLIGQIFWAGASYFIKKWSLFASSMFFVGLNLYAMFIRF